MASAEPASAPRRYHSRAAAKSPRRSCIRPAATIPAVEPPSAAARYQRSASSASAGPPHPISATSPRSATASADPASAARRYHSRACAYPSAVPLSRCRWPRLRIAGAYPFSSAAALNQCLAQRVLRDSPAPWR